MVSAAALCSQATAIPELYGIDRRINKRDFRTAGRTGRQCHGSSSLAKHPCQSSRPVQAVRARESNGQRERFGAPYRGPCRSGNDQPILLNLCEPLAVPPWVVARIDDAIGFPLRVVEFRDDVARDRFRIAERFDLRPCTLKAPARGVGVERRRVARRLGPDRCSQPFCAAPRAQLIGLGGPWVPLWRRELENADRIAGQQVGGQVALVEL